MIVSVLLLPIINVFNDLETTSHQSAFEWRQFHFYLANELNDSESVTLGDHSIQLNQSDNVFITFELRDGLIRRVKNNGHEVMIRDVNRFLVEQISQTTFKVFGERIDGQTYEKYYTFPIKEIVTE